MRRVYDNEHLDEVASEIYKILLNLPADEVSEYDYGMYRAKVGKIRQYIADRIPVKYGQNDHLHGIGNNNAIELIVTVDGEEQVCGHLHLTNDMFGSVIWWVSDIDGITKTETLTIHGTDPHNTYEMKLKRFARGRYWGRK